MNRSSAAAEFVIVGGGTAGAAIAGRLAETGREVCLLEAGPDFGPLNENRWPERLLDPSLMPVDLHSWRYVNSGVHGAPRMAMQRARVIGGCSSHNGCAVVWGHRADYDAWRDAGNPGWGADDLRPFFERGTERFRVHTPAATEVTPFHQAVVAAAPSAGLPPITDFLDFDITHGLGVGPVNIDNRLRWNAAFAYLDPVRDRPNFRLLADTLAHRIVIERGRAVAIEGGGPDGPVRIEADRIVLAGGAYGSPLLLQRSGIGAAADLRPAGIAVNLELPGVGRNLHDHPAVQVQFTGTPALTGLLDEFVALGGLPREEGTIALTSSSRCEGPFDLHLYPIAHRNSDGDWSISISAAVMCARSTGSIRVVNEEPEAAPHIDHAYLTDTDGYDLAVLVAAVFQIRELAATTPLRELIGTETGPLAKIRDAAGLAAMIPAVSGHDYHPAGTCKMGPASDPTAVVDAAGRVLGIEGLFIGDAAIMPAVPRANTNLPTLAVAEKIVAGLIAT